MKKRVTPEDFLKGAPEGWKLGDLIEVKDSIRDGWSGPYPFCGMEGNRYAASHGQWASARLYQPDPPWEPKEGEPCAFWMTWWKDTDTALFGVYLKKDSIEGMNIDGQASSYDHIAKLESLDDLRMTIGELKEKREWI